MSDLITTLILVTAVAAVVTAVGNLVYALLEALREAFGVDVHRRWIDIVLGMAVGIAVVVVVGGWLRPSPVDFCVPGEPGCEVASVSNAPQP